MNETTLPAPRARPDHRRLIGKLALIVAASATFGIALVPLYDTLCRVTGFNGKTFTAGGLAASDKPIERVDRSRLVRVEFTGTVMPGLPWELRPLTNSVELHPGEAQQVAFLVRNTANEPVTGQAIPSVTPGQAAQHFHKIECFCFNQQALGPGEARELPLMFIVKPELDADVRTITLSYAFFKAPAASTSPAPRKDGRP